MVKHNDDDTSYLITNFSSRRRDDSYVATIYTHTYLCRNVLLTNSWETKIILVIIRSEPNDRYTVTLPDSSKLVHLPRHIFTHEFCIGSYHQ